MTHETPAPQPPDEYLQRIPPGLPVRVAETPDRVLRVSHAGTGSLLLTAPLADTGAAPCEETFDGTLEFFEEARRLSEAEIEALARSPSLLSGRPEKRLVLNHGESFDPLADPGWRSSEIEIVKRPTLSRGRGERGWTLALTLGGEVRVYLRDAEGGWRRTDSPTEPLQPPRDADRGDRYRRMCRSIPTTRRSSGGFTGVGRERDLERRLAEYSLGATA